MNVFQHIEQKKKSTSRQLAVLIDPDKTEHLPEIIEKSVVSKIDYFFVGGSLITHGDIAKTIDFIKSNCTIPVVIFPGDSAQIYSGADAILLLSLISGRNPEFLIGQHIHSAFRLKSSGLELIPTGYIIVDNGITTTAAYVSGTNPIPSSKPEIAAITALAGEQLGLKQIYIDGGSGAGNPLSEDLIKKVRSLISVPLIVGGGIRTKTDAEKAWNAGADLVVIGTAIEKDPEFILQFKER
ncbi:MAG: geranylgeranylglyceryl/heptaprenylglyceryl phosphate synthase [Flavobacteriales bacterium]|nr:geranylgeranylglyceryl/heptaprenylglyceryl phosphate synthase [Flavobacteriales bacterium]